MPIPSCFTKLIKTNILCVYTLCGKTIRKKKRSPICYLRFYYPVRQHFIAMYPGSKHKINPVHFVFAFVNTYMDNKILRCLQGQYLYTIKRKKVYIQSKTVST